MRALSYVTTSAVAAVSAGVTTINMAPWMAPRMVPGWPDHGPPGWLHHGSIMAFYGFFSHPDELT